MADTIIFGEESGSKVSRESADRLGLANASVDIADVRTYVDEYTKISKENNWEQISMSTAQGATFVNTAYVGAVSFDGRYMYYSPFASITVLRFDTQSQFNASASWEQISLSTAQGAAAVGSACWGTVFDGRYVYLSAHSADTFLRFDTKGTSFTTVGDWEQMSMSTAQGATFVAFGYGNPIFDGRYIYFSPYFSDTFLRFDTQGTSLATADDWEQMSMSTAQGANPVDNAFLDTAFDGRYVYFGPYNGDTFVRFDTQGTSFTTTADWETMAVSTAQGAAVANSIAEQMGFDGRYIYFAAYNIDTFLRFDTQGTSFTTVGDWDKMSMSTAIGAMVDAAFGGLAIDGRYVYFIPMTSATAVRFDTQGISWTTAADWQGMSVSTAQGAAAVSSGHFGAGYDGKYVYFSCWNSDTFLRVLASSSTLKL